MAGWVCARACGRAGGSCRQLLFAAKEADAEFTAVRHVATSRADLRRLLSERLLRRPGLVRALGLSLEDGAAARFAEAAAAAFLDQDLLRAARGLMAGASGDLALFASCSLDAGRRLVLAARGRPLSVAFYPRLGLVLWGSDQVGLGGRVVAVGGHFC